MNAFRVTGRLGYGFHQAGTLQDDIFVGGY